MNAVPAKVAGVPRLVMTVPAPDGKLSPLVLAAAKLSGVDEIFRVGGAQAIAALAYGTKTIKPVAKIVGPGNAYVAAAKRLVFGSDAPPMLPLLPRAKRMIEELPIGETERDEILSRNALRLLGLK
jgi:predicted TIM-barrel fold metal-dependent hydrolase